MTAYPAALPQDEMELIRAKERLLMEAGWASEAALVGGGCPEAGAVPSAQDAVPTAKPVPQAALVKCKNCKAWFSAADTALEAVVAEEGESAGAVAAHALLSPRTRREFKCQFHPGRYRRAGVTVSTYVYVGWSCCKSKDESAPGCKLLINHREDAETTACLQPFAAQEESDMSKELLRRLTEAEIEERGGEDAQGGVSADEEDEARSVVGVENGERGRGEVLHPVLASDTLAGLSLRYGALCVCVCVCACVCVSATYLAGISTQRLREANVCLTHK